MNVSPLNERYKIETASVPTKPGCWNHTVCSVIDMLDPFRKDAAGTKIGEYVYEYHCGAPFHVFEQDGKPYALYSTSYTATRVMELPSCKDICGEPKDSFGFCPTGFAVPYGKDENEGVPFNGQFGFVCGCVWGDDSSWKIQYLDLSMITKGHLGRDARMGYIELLGSANTLADAIEVWLEDDGGIEARIACANTFDLQCDPREPTRSASASVAAASFKSDGITTNE